MGKLKCILLITALCILASCAKEERFSSDGFGPSDMANCFGQGYHGKVFMVPVPLGTDDTENIMNTIALAQSQGPGSVVQFQKGTYHIGFIEIREFEGTIKGAGKDKTIIKPVPNLSCQNEKHSWTGSLVSFIGGDIQLSDLSFIVDDGDPCAENYSNPVRNMGRDLYILVKFTDRINDYYVSEDLTVSATIQNTGFTGGINSGGCHALFNVVCGLWFGHDYFMPPGTNPERTKGYLNVENCCFSHFSTGLDLPGMKEGKIIVRNSLFNFSNLLISDNINLQFNIADNKFLNNYDYNMFIDDSDLSRIGRYNNTTPVKRATYRISGNMFETRPGVTFIRPGGVSIYILDMRTAIYPDENMPMKFMVENNVFKLHEGATAIVGLNNKDAMILANKFSGEGVKGISLDGENAAYSLNNKILGNNFAMADYETDIYLGQRTKNSLVAGSPIANIVDEGAGNQINGKPK